jgi:hypothetical protein
LMFDKQTSANESSTRRIDGRIDGYVIKAPRKALVYLILGGEGGIRTRVGILSQTRFPGVRLKPLIHLSERARRINHKGIPRNLRDGIHRKPALRRVCYFKCRTMRANTVSRGNKATTASTDGVWVCPVSITRSGIASLGIFKPCFETVSLIVALMAAVSHVICRKRSSNSCKAGTASGVN